MSVILGYLAKSKNYTLSLDEIVQEIASDKRFLNMPEEDKKEFVSNCIDSLKQEKFIREVVELML